MPGGQVVAGDDTMLPSASHVLEDLDRLTPEQQAFVDEQVDAVFGEAAIIDEFTLYPDESAVRGFRSPVSSEMQLAVRSVADSLRSLLGGPPLKVHVVVVDGSSLGTGGSMSGTWRAQPDSIAFMFEQASVFGPEAPAIDVGAVTGDLLMTFDEGGTGTLEYRDVTLFLVDSPLSDLTINGGGTFDWTVDGGRTIISATEYVISVGSSALGEPLTIGSDDLPGGGTTALAGVQAGDELTITAATGSAGAVFFPIIWRRV